MATIPRTYLTTSKAGLSSIPPRNGQVISIWDSDEVWYDAPINGERDGMPVRRKISGVKVVDTLPDEPMTDIVYVYIGDHGTIPDPEDPDHPKQLYDMRIWVNDEWLVVGSNRDDTTVRTSISDGKFYLAGAEDITNNIISALRKNSSVYVQNGELYGTLRGNADTATNAVRAASAALADTADKDTANPPKAITGYLYDIQSDATTNLGSTLTITKGDGTSDTIRVSDTTYSVYTNDTAGLVNGTNVTVDSDSTNLLLSGDGWINITDFDIPSADSAINDSAGQKISETYIKGLSYNTTSDELTVTKGDGASSTISIPNTEYSVFTVSDNGLVPAASGSGDTSKFLKGDGTWATVNQEIYPGADPTAPVSGLVPAANSGELTKVLSGNGSWLGTFSTSVDGLVPAASGSGDTNRFLKGDGTWADAVDTLNTAGSTQDTNMLYLVGAKTQSSSAQTYSNAKVYINNDKLYSNNVEVVDISSAQAITNKTSYNGYVLGNACAASIGTTLNQTTTTQDIFSGDGSTTQFTLTNSAPNVVNLVSVLVGSVDKTSEVSLSGNVVTFTTAPVSGTDNILIDYTITNSGYDGDALPKSSVVRSYVTSSLNDVSSTIVGRLNDIVVAPRYDSTATYAVKDFVTYIDDGQDYARLYRCSSAITSPETFTPAHWVETTIIDAIKYLIANP